jgi:Ca2+/Na+ antiporter
MAKKSDFLYREQLSSTRTEALFLALMAVFFILFLWRLHACGLDILAAVFLCLSGVFLFYAVNYRTLVIRLTDESLTLAFGVFAWSVPLKNIEDCRLDDAPFFLRMGGAGIHFLFVQKRYRASFNFLEYPSVVIALKRKAGPVRDISFSTRYPEDVLRAIRSGEKT